MWYIKLIVFLQVKIISANTAIFLDSNFNVNTSSTNIYNLSRSSGLLDIINQYNASSKMKHAAYLFLMPTSYNNMLKEFTATERRPSISFDIKNLQVCYTCFI